MRVVWGARSLWDSQSIARSTWDMCHGRLRCHHHHGVNPSSVQGLNRKASGWGSNEALRLSVRPADVDGI
jgi:hypothetical protein